jgi:hypothetical protein
MRLNWSIGTGCRSIRAALEALAGAPASALPAWAAKHLARCSSCARTVAAARLARGLVAQTTGEPEVPAGFAERVLAATARASRREEGAAELWAPARKLLPAFAAAAACCLILLRVMGTAEPPGYLSGEDLTPGEQLVLGVTPPDPDAVLTVVMVGDAR